MKTETIKQKIKGLLKIRPKKDVVVLNANDYNDMMKQIEFFKGLENNPSSFFNNKFVEGLK